MFVFFNSPSCFFSISNTQFIQSFTHQNRHRKMSDNDSEMNDNGNHNANQNANANANANVNNGEGDELRRQNLLREGDELDGNLGQRMRHVMVPFDSALEGNRRFNRSEKSNIIFLSSGKSNLVNMNNTYIVGQILRIVSPIANNNAYVNRTYRGGVTQTQQVAYIRLILLRVHNEDGDNENSELFYLMITRDDNNKLFHRDLELRDNGVISIGSYLRILAPCEIEKNLQGIPLIVTKKSAIAMREPLTLPNIPINKEIYGDTAVSSILNGKYISCTRTDATDTTCSGLLCDKQCVSDWNTQNRGCGCFSKNANRSPIALSHTVVIESAIGLEPLVMTEFSSSKFNKLFLKDHIPASVRLQCFEDETLDGVEDAIEECMDFINNNGGFTIVLWYRRGAINDVSLLGQRSTEDGQIAAGNVNYHIIQISPTNRDLLDPTSRVGRVLQSLKFDTATMRQV